MRQVLRKAAVLCLALSGPVAADEVVQRTVEQLILPAMADFSNAAIALAEMAKLDCRAEAPALKPAFHAAFDAWLLAAPYELGPVDAQGQSLPVAFWPDPKGMTQRALAGLLQTPGMATIDYASQSIAARGFFALESMLYDPMFIQFGLDDPGCVLVPMATADLAATAEQLNQRWVHDLGPGLASAGPDNSRYRTDQEARAALLTTLVAALDFVADKRLGRPLGTIDAPRPTRAEAIASGRPQRNIVLSLAAARALADQLSQGGDGDLMANFDYAEATAAALKDPLLADVATPAGQLRVQNVRDAVERVILSLHAELGPELGVSAGFNALDGD
jgi:uncharacterized protein